MKNSLKSLISSTLVSLATSIPQATYGMDDFSNLTEHNSLSGMQRKGVAEEGAQELSKEVLSKETKRQKTNEKTDENQKLLLRKKDESIQSSDKYNDEKQCNNVATPKKNFLEKLFPLEKTSEITRELLKKIKIFSIEEYNKSIVVSFLLEAGSDDLDIIALSKNLAEKIKRFTFSKHILCDCKNILEFYKEFDKAKSVAERLVVVLETLSRFYLERVILYREKEPDSSFKLPDAIIDSLEQSIKYSSEMYYLKDYINIMCADDKQFHFNRIHGWSLKGLWDIYWDLNIFYEQLMKNVHIIIPDLEILSNLDKQSKISLKLMKFIGTYFNDVYNFDYDSKEIQHFLNTRVEENKKSALSNANKKWNERIILLQSAKIAPMMFHPTYLLSKLNVFYCKAIKGMSFVADSLARSGNGKMKELYSEKSTQYLSQVIDFYKTHIYKNEYSSKPEKAEEFILARLDDLIDNPVPLTEFYRRLHQERRKKNEQRIGEAIRLQQEEARKKDKERSYQKAVLEKPTNNHEQKNNSEISLPEPTETEKEVIISSISVSTDKEPTLITPKEKKKTHGIADSSKSSKSLLATQKNGQVEREEPVQIYLNTEDFFVFQSLTAGSMDRNIILDSVKKLLTSKAFNCKIQTGGNHPKMVAPNGGSWAIPPKWDGPISAYYRQQLNDFLQNTMEIDPETVFERQIIVNNGKKKNNKK